MSLSYFLKQTTDRQPFLCSAHLLAFHIGLAFLLHSLPCTKIFWLKATWRHASMHLRESRVACDR